jgi:hypothetical protein
VLWAALERRRSITIAASPYSGGIRRLAFLMTPPKRPSSLQVDRRHNKPNHHYTQHHSSLFPQCERCHTQFSMYMGDLPVEAKEVYFIISLPQLSKCFDHLCAMDGGSIPNDEQLA